MALRIEKTACLILLGLAIASGEDLVFTARHRHLHKGGPGSLSFTETGVRWEETKERDHCFDWKYSDLQRLELWPDHVHIVTYDDIDWQLGRDREYEFDKLPPDLAARVYPLLITRMDQRFQRS